MGNAVEMGDPEGFPKPLRGCFEMGDTEGFPKPLRGCFEMGDPEGFPKPLRGSRRGAGDTGRVDELSILRSVG